MNELLVIGAMATMILVFLALYGAMKLIERIPVVRRWLDDWMPEGWDR